MSNHPSNLVDMLSYENISQVINEEEQHQTPPPLQFGSPLFELHEIDTEEDESSITSNSSVSGLSNVSSSNRSVDAYVIEMIDTVDASTSTEPQLAPVVTQEESSDAIPVYHPTPLHLCNPIPMFRSSLVIKKRKTKKLTKQRVKDSLKEKFMSPDIETQLKKSLTHLESVSICITRIHQLETSLFCGKGKLLNFKYFNYRPTRYSQSKTVNWVPYQPTPEIATKLELLCKLFILKELFDQSFNNFHKEFFVFFRPFFDILAQLIFDFIGHVFEHRYVMSEDGKEFMLFQFSFENFLEMMRIFLEGDYYQYFANAETPRDVKIAVNPDLRVLLQRRKEEIEQTMAKFENPCVLCEEPLSDDKILYHWCCKNVSCLKCWKKWDQSTKPKKFNCPACVSNERCNLWFACNNVDTVPLPQEYYANLCRILHMFRNVVVYRMFINIVNPALLDQYQFLDMVFNIDNVFYVELMTKFYDEIEMWVRRGLNDNFLDKKIKLIELYKMPLNRNVYNINQCIFELCKLFDTIVV